MDIHLKVELSTLCDPERAKKAFWDRMHKLCSFYHVACTEIEVKTDHLYEAELTFQRREPSYRFMNFYFQFCIETLVNSLRGNGFLDARDIEVLNTEPVTFSWS